MWLSLLLASALSAEPSTTERVYLAKALCVLDWKERGQILVPDPRARDPLDGRARVDQSVEFENYAVVRGGSEWLEAVEYAEIMAHDDIVDRVALDRRTLAIGGGAMLGVGLVAGGIGTGLYVDTKRQGFSAPREAGVMVSGLVLAGLGGILVSQRNKPGRRYTPYYGVQELREQTAAHNAALAEQLRLANAPTCPERRASRHLFRSD